MQPLFQALTRREFSRMIPRVSAGVVALQGFGSWATAQGSSMLTRDRPAPVDTIRTSHFEAMHAFVRAQLALLTPDQSLAGADATYQTTEEVLRYISFLSRDIQNALVLCLMQTNVYMIQTTGMKLSELSPHDIARALNQGERPSTYPLIDWRNQTQLHSAVTGLTHATRLVVCSQPTPRKVFNMQWSASCSAVRSWQVLRKPSYPDLDQNYDVCVIGSGAGGSVVASEAAAAGLKVLIVEEGDWVDPSEMVAHASRHQGELRPAEDHQALIRLYKDAGVQWTVDVMETLSASARPVQSINVLQAKVVGGGPYVNNAIHLRIDESTWNGWPASARSGTYADLLARMQKIEADLGVNTQAPYDKAGAPSRKFYDLAQRANVAIKPLPVSIRLSTPACGADNATDPFDGHIGGLHHFRASGKNSYLMSALHASTPAQIAYGLRAMHGALSTDDPTRIDHFLVEDRRQVGPSGFGPLRKIRAREFIIAAGVGNSTKLVAATLGAAHYRNRHLGEAFTANVVTPVYAVFDSPLQTEDSTVPKPGLAMCFYVKEHQDSGGRVVEPLLETWFQYPGTLSFSLAGWFDEWMRVMRLYNHLSICGALVSTRTRPENKITPSGLPRMTLNHDEFAQTLRGVAKISRIYLSSAAQGEGVSIVLPTKSPLTDERGNVLRIRDEPTLQRALEKIRQEGPEFLQMTTFHPQGGNPLGRVVSPGTQRVRFEFQSESGFRDFDNLRVADGSVFPDACLTNPQLTLKALALGSVRSFL